MSSSIAMGIFAFIAAGTSLVRIMSDREFYRLTAMKRKWGRSRGLALFFVSNVVLPLLFGIVFVSSGATGVRLVQPLIADHPFPPAPAAAPLFEESTAPFVSDSYLSLA